MKLLFALAAVASAEKGRPDKIDAPKRLENLQNWSEKCLEELEGANGNLVRKFEWFNKVARAFSAKHDELSAEVEGDNEVDRLNRDDPCTCLSGVANGYKSFFNRVDGDQKEKNKRGRAVGQTRKIQAKLNANHGCNVPTQ